VAGTLEVSCQVLVPSVPVVSHIPITRTDYASQVNHIVPVPAPIVKGVPQPYAVPVPQPFSVPRAVPVAVPRAIPVEVPRPVPVPLVAKAPTMFTASVVDAGTKLLDARPAGLVADMRMINPWGAKMVL